MVFLFSLITYFCSNSVTQYVTIRVRQLQNRPATTQFCSVQMTGEILATISDLMTQANNFDSNLQKNNTSQWKQKQDL